jgi:hypothetical protein
VRSLAPDDLVARLDQCFKLLTRGSRNSLERHQTLRATIDWSYDMLTDEERAAFNRLSAFAGGFDLVAAEAVLGDDHLHAEDTARLLAQLVDKSLVVAQHQAHGTRYRLLETIRQYALERLEQSGETAAVRRRHMHHYVGVAETAAPRLRNRDQLSTATGLAPDMDNLRAAFDYALDASLYDPALRLVGALAVTGLPIGWTAMGWAPTAAAIPGATSHQLFPLVVAYAATDAAMNGQLARATGLAEAAEAGQLALGTNHLEVHIATASLGLFRGDLERARHDAECCLEQARAIGEPYLIVGSLMLLAAALSGDPERGVVVAEEAARLARDEGLVSLLGLALLAYGSYVGGKDPALDLAVHEEVIGIATALGDQQLLVAAVASRESMRARQGDWPSVLRAYADATAQFTDARFAVDAFYGAALAFIALEHFEPGAVILGFADAHFLRWQGNEELTGHLTAAEQALLNALGQDTLSVLEGRGSALDLPDVVAYLRTEADRALAEVREPRRPK